jgi:methyl-accepting chemotaxis protein
MPFRLPAASSVAGRLLFGFTVLLAMLVAMASLGLWQVRTLGERIQTMVETTNLRAELAHGMLDAINEMAIQVRTATLLTDVKQIDIEAARVKQARDRYLVLERQLQGTLEYSLALQPGERELMAQIAAAGAATLPLVLQATTEGQDGATVEATLTLMTRVKPAEQVWRNKVAELIALEKGANDAAAAPALAGQRTAVGLMAALVPLAVALGVLLAWRTVRSITRPIAQATLAAERIAGGDLCSTVEAGGDDEIGRLLQAVATMQAQLRRLVGDIRAAADSIQSASGEVASGNQDLSVRTEQAASSLQMTASSVEQLAGTVTESAGAAREASTLAADAARVAARGGSTMADVVATMGAISGSSKQIADITGVIDGIAFQTNILALNAAVEAARAGEQGRGFAVVASEVRSLAQRSAEAAKEIKALIAHSTQRVDDGARLVGDAGATVGRIVDGVQQVSAIIDRIAASAAEQGGGIGQVHVAVGQLDRMIQQNAALVEQSAAAAQSLNDQATRLNRMVGAFQV